MAIPHSRSVHLLIDLLLADSVMGLSSSDYHDLSRLFVCLFALQSVESFNTGDVKVDTSCTYIQVCKCVLCNLNKIRSSQIAGCVMWFLIWPSAEDRRSRGQQQGNGKKEQEKQMSEAAEWRRRLLGPAWFAGPIKRWWSRKRAKLSETFAPKSPT